MVYGNSDYTSFVQSHFKKPFQTQREKKSVNLKSKDLDVLKKKKKKKKQ